MEALEVPLVLRADQDMLVPQALVVVAVVDTNPENQGHLEPQVVLGHLAIPLAQPIVIQEMV